MSSKNNYEQRTSYVQRFNLSNMSNMRTRRKPQKLCPDCKETNDCVKLLSNKVNKVEEIVSDFYKNLQKKEAKRTSVFNAKFILNNVPCELEYDLSKFTLENLQKLENFAIPNHNNNNNNNDKDNNNPSSV
ncbi:hypothetical protein RhiirC2_738824 [Rhizophagus irregularis]|uniref:Uncharacterized protein n=1 Tax=Rhizophagus irregularis TaxID=588596 RepID=A0A2N1NKR7_9GLOM|nr:hypothetical protein RhiirC2_738824 [Rhizophagus irregularis]